MWNLLALAVRVKLDAFTKDKAAMDKMLAELKLQTDMTLEAQERKTNKVMTTLMTAAKKNHKVESLGSCSAREACCLHQGQGSRGQNVGGAQDPPPASSRLT